MNKGLILAGLGLLAGIAIGYCKEDEIHDLTRDANRMKRKLKHGYEKTMGNFCDCFED